METYSARKFKYIIVDSQLDDVNDLQSQLSKFTNFVCVSIARSKEEALNVIIDHLPQLVFFATELTYGIKTITSFSLIHELRQFMDILPQFVALSTTTSDSYEAIKTGVFDYLLKPLNYFDLKKCVMRFEKKQPESSIICIKSFAEYRFMDVNDIIYLKADNNTTDFYLKDGSVVTSFNTLKTFETQLPNIITRVHKSYMININYLTKIHFRKFQCMLKYVDCLIPFSKSLKSKMSEIKDSLLKGNVQNLTQFLILE